MPDGRWMRIGEVADLLGVSVGTARNYFDAGRFQQQWTRRLAHGDRRVWSVEADRFLREEMGTGGTPSPPDPDSLADGDSSA